jgi:hypothetical protein
LAGTSRASIELGESAVSKAAVRRPKADSFGMTDAAEKAFSVQYENYGAPGRETTMPCTCRKCDYPYKNAKKMIADRS